MPSIFKIYQDWVDKKHEYRVLELQLKQSKQTQDGKLQAIEMKLDLEKYKTAYLTFGSKNKTIDALNAFVRPAFAYAFLLIYIGITCVYGYKLWEAPPGVFADEMWTATDETIMQAVIGFYFGSRTSEKAMG